MEVAVAGISRGGRARVIGSAEEDARARGVLLSKYRPRSERYRNRWGGDVERWGKAPVAVAVELDDEAP